MTRSKLTKGLMAGAAALATAASLAAVPTAASAQSAPYYGSGYGQPGPYYDPCRRDTTTRSTVGGLSGAAIGAAIGSGIAARGVRTEGAVLGGLLGAGAQQLDELGAVAVDPRADPLARQGQGHEDTAGHAVALGADPLDLEFAQRHRILIGQPHKRR